jgi:hypothetical protein
MEIGESRKFLAPRSGYPENMVAHHGQETAAAPVNQAFVIQISFMGTLAEGDCAGKVEHVASGKAQCFANLTELNGFIRQMTRLPLR